MLSKLSDYSRDWIIRDKTAVEGGYSNLASDAGGETNHGITAALAHSYKNELIINFYWDGKMVNLSKEMAFWLYKTEFWDKLRGDDLFKRHPLLADKVFDFGINAGKGVAVKILQTYLSISNQQGKFYADLEVDGAIGNGTLKALDAYLKARGKDGMARLLFAFICEQGSFYNRITVKRAQNEDFIYGWYGRAQADNIEYNRLLGLEQTA